MWGLPWWPRGLRHCHWLLAVSHHCLGLTPGRGEWVSYQWLEVRLWFSPGTPFSSTSYNWLVASQPQYSRKGDEKTKFKKKIWKLHKVEKSIRVQPITHIFYRCLHYSQEYFSNNIQDLSHKCIFVRESMVGFPLTVLLDIITLTYVQ